MSQHSQEHVKIKFEMSSGCVFMVQQVKARDREYLLGSSIDGYLFLYKVDNNIGYNNPVSWISTGVYPVCTANYSEAVNTLVCGTVDGSIYVFKAFSQKWLGQPIHYFTKEEPDHTNFAICTYPQDNHVYSIHYPLAIYRIDLHVDNPARKISPWKQFKTKISQAIYFQPLVAAGPHLAINFIDEQPPIVLNQISEYFEREHLRLEEEEEESVSTCMCYCRKTHEVIVGCYNGDVNVYSIVTRGDGTFCQKRLGYEFASEKLILQVCCWEDQLFILTVKAIQVISLESRKKLKRKMQAEGAKNIKGLLTILDQRIIVLGSKTLTMLQNPHKFKECTIKLLFKL